MIFSEPQRGQPILCPLLLRHDLTRDVNLDLLWLYLAGGYSPLGILSLSFLLVGTLA